MLKIPPKKYERRLDALAEILQGRSACVAVANINGRFLITANERFNYSQHLDIVKEIMIYFRDIATSGEKEVNDHTRDQILSRIYYLKMDTKALGDGALKISKPDLLLGFISSSKMAARHWPTESECSGVTENNLFLKACIAYALIRDLYGSFVKIEHGLIKAVNNEKFHIVDQEEVAITQRELTAFRNFKEEDILVKKDFHANNTSLVHAEMQILSFLLSQKYKSPIYIGVSKRCCWDCHCMIRAANEILEQHSISLRANVRDDAHDGKSDPWNKPNIFMIEIKDELLKQIIKKIEIKYNELKKIIPQSRDYVQLHSRSNSEVSLDHIGKKAIYLREQETRRQVLLDLFDSSDNSERNFTMKQNLDILDFSIQLCEQNYLEDLFKISEQDGKESISVAIDTIFSAMLSYCDKEKIDSSIIKIFIKIPSETNKHFPDIVFRELILTQLNMLFDERQKELSSEVSQYAQTSPNTVLVVPPKAKRQPKLKSSAK